MSQNKYISNTTRMDLLGYLNQMGYINDEQLKKFLKLTDNEVISIDYSDFNESHMYPHVNEDAIKETIDKLIDSPDFCVFNVPGSEVNECSQSSRDVLLHEPRSPRPKLELGGGYSSRKKKSLRKKKLLRKKKSIRKKKSLRKNKSKRKKSKSKRSRK